MIRHFCDHCGQELTMLNLLDDHPETTSKVLYVLDDGAGLPNLEVYPIVRDVCSECVVNALETFVARYRANNAARATTRPRHPYDRAEML